MAGHDSEQAAVPSSGGGKPQTAARGSGYGAAFKSLVIYSLGILAGKLASVILVPLYTHRLSQAEYGALELLDVTLQAASKLFWGGFPYAFWYFFANASSEEQRKRVVSTGVLGALLFGSAGALILGAASPWISGLVFETSREALLLRIIFASLAFSLPTEAMLCWFRIVDRPASYVATGIARLVLQTSSAVFLLAFCGLGLVGVLWSNVIAASVSATVLLVYGIRTNGVAFDFRLFGRMLRYAAPSVFVGLCSFLLHFGNRYFLQRSVSLPELGVYSLAAKLGMLIMLLQYGFQGYWNAQVFHIAARPDAGALLGRALTYLTLALSATALAVTAFAKPVVALMAPPSYAPSALLAPVICVGYAMFGISAFFQTLFYVKKKTGSDAVANGVGAAVAFAAYFLLIPRYGLWGAAIATLVSFIAPMILGIVWSRRFITVEYEGGRLFKATAPAAALACLCLLAPLHGTLVQLGAGILAMLAYGAVLLLTRFADGVEKRLVRQAVSKALDIGATLKGRLR